MPCVPFAHVRTLSLQKPNPCLEVNGVLAHSLETEKLDCSLLISTELQLCGDLNNSRLSPLPTVHGPLAAPWQLALPFGAMAAAALQSENKPERRSAYVTTR